MAKESQRSVDWNGFMEVRNNPISKVGVWPYLGSEIPGAPNPDEIYWVYRPAEELARQETIDSFKLMPFIDEHEVLGRGGMPAERKGIQGTIGEQVYFDPPYLRANIKIHSSAAQSLIKAGKVELSPCYGCDWSPEVGTFEGKPYQYVQRNIMGNHLALVEEGRTGPDVAVQDHRKFTLDSAELLPMALAPEDMEAIKTMVLELLADQKKPGDADPESEKPKDEDPEAKDEDEVASTAEEEGQAGGDTERAAERIDEVVEQVEEAIEEIKEASEDLVKASDAKARKTAQDRMTKAKGKLAAAKAAHANLAKDSANRIQAAQVVSLTKQVKALQDQLAATKATASDSAPLLGVIADRDALYSQVSHFTGAFDHSRMDAKAVAVYACDKLSIKCDKGQETVALNAWMQGRKPEQPSGHAADSAKRGNAFAEWSKK